MALHKVFLTRDRRHALIAFAPLRASQFWAELALLPFIRARSGSSRPYRALVTEDVHLLTHSSLKQLLLTHRLMLTTLVLLDVTDCPWSCRAP